jgi:hypothetical protein
MRVIAIKDAPIVSPTKLVKINNVFKKVTFNNTAYKVGDIFELSKEYSDPNYHRTYMVIFNHHIGSYMEVNYENFITLDEHRENQINELLSV